jgi:hypothetical protein
MKTKTLLTALMACLTLALSGQSNDRKVRFSLGMEPHLNWIGSEDTHISKGPVRAALSGGVRIDYRFMKPFAFSFGANWNQTGGNIIYSVPIPLDLSAQRDTLMAGTRITYRLRYVEIPVALKIVLPEMGYSTWFIEAGLDPMFITGGFIDATDNNIDKVPFEEGVTPFNLAWHGGLGIDYSLGRFMSLRFELLYKNTFLDITREQDIRKPDNARVNQVGLCIALVF